MLQLAYVAASSGQFAVCVLRARQRQWQTRASLAADLLGFVALGAALVLCLVNFRRSLRPSTPLALYLSTLVILGTARVRTMWLIKHDTGVPAAETATFTFTVAALLLESFQNDNIDSYDKLSGTREQYSGFWVRTSFTWILDTLLAGYSKVITLVDLPGLDLPLQSHVLHTKLVSTWKQCRLILINCCGYL